MASPITLQDLVESISHAVIQAQDRIEKHQIANLSNYFDKDNRPVSVNLRVPNPSLHSSEDKPEVELSVPLITLVAFNQLKIKDVEVSFDVELGEFAIDEAPEAPEAPTQTENGEESATDASNSGPWRGTPSHKPLSVDARSRVVGGKGGAAKVVLRLEGQEHTEGMSRLIHHLIKSM